MGKEVYLKFKDITKTFPGVVANEKVNLEIFKGEIHALLGENGAGKSTLMNILYGLYKQDSGEIYLKGKELVTNSPRDAIDNGIGMIHQHFMLVPRFTVLENIVLGQPSEKPPLLDLAKLRQDVQEAAEKFNIKVNLDAVVEDLAVGVQQRVEILKALYKGAELLILDEPTSVLTPQESQDLFRMLMSLKEKGCTIIFISHKLKEIMQICERITVLRDGKVIKTVNKAETTPEELSKLMVGRDISFRITKNEAQVGEEVLVLEKVSLHSDKSMPLLQEVSLRIRAGEILGIAGVDGNGQRELAEVISGLQKPSSGKIRFFGQDVTGATTRQLIEMGLSFIPADRRNQGLVTEHSIAENFILETFYQKPFTKGISLDRNAISTFAEQLIKEYDVKTPHYNIPVKNLSGGNQQKVVVGREIAKKPKILLVMQPTWGLDVGACEFVYKKLLEEREKGVAILLISTELEEVRSLADRLVVLYEGQIMGEVDPKTATVEEIGLMMAGARREDSSLPSREVVRPV